MSYGVSITRFGRTAPPLTWKNFKGRQARRPTGGAADKVRVHHQPQSGKTDRPNNSAERSGAGG